MLLVCMYLPVLDPVLLDLVLTYASYIIKGALRLRRLRQREFHDVVSALYIVCHDELLVGCLHLSLELSSWLD